jgi:hypothetical protein
MKVVFEFINKLFSKYVCTFQCPIGLNEISFETIVYV